MLCSFKIHEVLEKKRRIIVLENARTGTYAMPCTLDYFETYHKENSAKQQSLGWYRHVQRNCAKIEKRVKLTNILTQSDKNQTFHHQTIRNKGDGGKFYFNQGNTDHWPLLNKCTLYRRWLK